jgi:crotonobetaine/carnitine-CoA ligase
MKEYPFEERVIGHILEDKARAIGEKTYCLHGDVKVTYQEMNETVNRVANSLIKQGIKKGDKVCMIMTNSLEFLYTRFALAKIGAVMVPVNIALKGNLLTYIIDNSDASVIVVDVDLTDRVIFIQKELKKIKTIIIVPDYLEKEKEIGFTSDISVKKFIELYDGSPENPTSEVHFYDPIVIMYTSGTTGPSKGVILSHAHHYAVAYEESHFLRYTEDSIVYSCLPLFHANASMASQGAILAEGKFALGKKFSLSGFWDEIRKYGATHTNILATIFPLLWRQPRREDDAKNTLKVMDASPVIPEFKEFEKRFGLKLITMFGLTESGVIMASPFEEEIRLGSCGKPLKAYDVRIFDDYDIECGPRVTGEIVVRGREPYRQMDGYYKMPDATVKAYRNLWFHTGDFGYMDEDGYFYFVDRKKDAIRRGGENISSFEVEQVINSHPKVFESAVLAVPSELSEDDVKAVVVLKDGEKMTPEELMSFCNDRMAYFAVPRYLEFKKSLPKTPTSRVEKYKLREEGVTKDTWDREKAGYKLQR